MQLTEKERLLLVTKKEEIRKLTEDIIELSVDVRHNSTELKKRVTSVLSLISTISSYSSRSLDMRPWVALAEFVFNSIEKHPELPRVAMTELDIFCNVANSITFSFAKRDFNINVQEIDLSIFRTGK